METHCFSGNFRQGNNLKCHPACLPFQSGATFKVKRHYKTQQIKIAIRRDGKSPDQRQHGPE